MIILIIVIAVSFIVFFAVMRWAIQPDQNRVIRDKIPALPIIPKPRFRMSFKSERNEKSGSIGSFLIRRLNDSAKKMMDDYLYLKSKKS